MGEHRFEFPRDHIRVVGAQPERDQRAGVAEHRMADIRIELMEVLVRQHHTHPELAQFGEHVGQSQRREILKFIDVDMEGSTGGFHLRSMRARSPELTRC